MKRKNLTVARKTHNFYLTKLRKPFIKKAYEDFSKKLEILNLKNKKIIIECKKRYFRKKFRGKFL